jgi:SOS-response transcriptional repressor LexA
MTEAANLQASFDEEDSARDDAFIARLGELADMAGSVSALARRAGVSQSGMHRYFSGGQPTRKVLVAIADALDIDLNWLMTGSGSRSRSQALPQLPDNLRTLTRLPVHSAARAEGQVEPLNVKGLGFCRIWLSQVGYEVAHLHGLYMRGDSMSPTISNGDALLINTSQKEMVDGEVYAISGDNGKILIKRIQNKWNNIVGLISDNTLYTPLDADLTDIEVLGRVVWKGGLLS